MPEPRTLEELLAYVRTRIAETDVDLRDMVCLAQRAGHHVAPGRWVFADLMQEDAGELFHAPGHA